MVLTTALSVCGMQRYTRRRHIVIQADPISFFWYQFLNYLNLTLVEIMEWS